MFTNNLYVGFLSIIFGVFLGIFPIMTAVFNGIIIGYVMNIAVSSEGFIILWKLLPHGIFELPAIFISMALGLKIFSSVFYGKRVLKNNFKRSLLVFVLVVTPLLILAALIEGFLIFFFK